MKSMCISASMLYSFFLSVTCSYRLHIYGCCGGCFLLLGRLVLHATPLLLDTIYPYSSLDILPFRTKYAYHIHHDNLQDDEVVLQAHHGWLGATTVCCTPMVRLAKWQIDFHRPERREPELNIDQPKNLLEVERGNDLLAALCIAYAFDKALCQPLVTIIGYRQAEYEPTTKRVVKRKKRVVRDNGDDDSDYDN